MKRERTIVAFARSVFKQRLPGQAPPFTVVWEQPESDGGTAFCGAVVCRKGGHAADVRMPKRFQWVAFFSSWQLPMWRSIFIAVGIMAIIIGLECLVIDSANFYSASETDAGSFVNPVSVPASNVQQWRPKEWFPWVILTAGGITVLYAITLPKRFGAAGAA